MNKEVSGLRVLLVDDDLTLLNLNTRLLEKLGIVVTAAQGGMQAIELINDDPAFDCFLVDCLMPEVDGFKVTKHIKKNPSTRNKPVVALTGISGETEVEKIMASGMNAYLEKPIKFDKMVKVLETVLGKPLTLIQRADTVQAEFPAIAGINLETGLRNTLQDHGLFLRLLDQFVTRQTTFGDRMDTILSQGDLKSAAMEAHSLKSVLETIGAEMFVQARNFEVLCLEDPGVELLSSSASALNRNLKELLLRVNEAVEKFAALRPNTEVSIEELYLLKEHLENHDTRARFLAENMQLQRSENEGLKKVANAVKSYDFDTALNHLQRVIDE